ncbi:hypothetical protein [Halegenticoccus soli]|uniref:hypothetical protein n=1 Tax=Halegenticoccus soli TaxID=1985678 RepID=UPI000C6D863C|nr:hypothetical protein [Halegenticoccus soli]
MLPDPLSERSATDSEETWERERLNDAIDAAVDADEVTKRDDYGEVVFRHETYRYVYCVS